MSERICVCGHPESDHEKAAKGAAICFHDPEPDNEDGEICPCMQFVPADEQAASASR